MPCDDPRGRKPRQSRSIAGLGLNIEAAEAGKYSFLLPKVVLDQPGAEYRYPVPSSPAECARVAALITRRGSHHPAAVYIRRCKKQAGRINRKVNLVRLDQALKDGEAAATRMERIVDTASSRVADEVERVRAHATATIASMGELSDLAKQAAGKILTAFVEGKPLNDAPVAPGVAVDTMGKVFTHVARLGAGVIDKGGQDEAEDTAMAEYVEATRKRLSREVNGDAGATH